MKLLLFLLTLSSLNMFAITHEIYSCTSEYVGDVTISLNHLRITEARVTAFGKVFHGWGNFNSNIQVSNKDTEYGESKMIHIPLISLVPTVMYVYHTGGRAPTTHQLHCEKFKANSTSVNNTSSPQSDDLIPPQMGQCGGPRTSC